MTATSAGARGASLTTDTMTAWVQRTYGGSPAAVDLHQIGGLDRDADGPPSLRRLLAAGSPYLGHACHVLLLHRLRRGLPP